MPPNDNAVPLSIRAFAKVWTVEDGLLEPTGRHSCYIWEPLDVDAPPDARPTCYFGDMIDFYDVTGNKVLARRVRHHDLSGDHILLDRNGIFWQVASGRVIHRDGRWWMRWLAFENTRLARMCQAGWPEYHK